MGSLTVTKIIPIAMVFQESHRDFRPFLSSIGIAPDIMDSPDNTVSDSQLLTILHEATSVTGDNNIGLHAGEAFNGLSNILGFLLLNCIDLEEAIEKYCRYQTVYDESFRLEFIYKDDLVIIGLIASNNLLAFDRQAIDLRLAGAYKYCRVLTGKELPLVGVHFTYKKPDDATEHNRFFNCPLRFSASQNALVFDRKVLRTPTLQPNRDLQILFEQYTRNVLEKHAGEKTYSRKVKELILEQMNGDAPTIDMISRVLKIGTRSLQIRLRDEGTTFSRLLDDVRKDLALEYLKNKDNTIAEVSYILGFSEPSVFHRRFKMWTNSTPGSYRNLTEAYQTD